jgi:hypothetical protein
MLPADCGIRRYSVLPAVCRREEFAVGFRGDRDAVGASSGVRARIPADLSVGSLIARTVTKRASAEIRAERMTMAVRMLRPGKSVR